MDGQRVTGFVIALSLGIGLSLYAYRLATDATPQRERQREEAAVAEARRILGRYVGVAGELEIVDPLQRNPAAGKTYIYPADGGWQVSGHYRRPPAVDWRPWLMTLDADRRLESLKVRDDEPRVRALARIDPRFDATS